MTERKPERAMVPMCPDCGGEVRFVDGCPFCNKCGAELWESELHWGHYPPDGAAVVEKMKEQHASILAGGVFDVGWIKVWIAELEGRHEM